MTALNLSGTDDTATVVPDCKPATAERGSVSPWRRDGIHKSDSIVFEGDGTLLSVANGVASMTPLNIESRIFDIVRRLFAPPDVPVNSDTTLISDLGLWHRSTRRAEFLMEVEAEFAIEIDDEMADALTTLASVVEYIEIRKSGG